MIEDTDPKDGQIRSNLMGKRLLITDDCFNGCLITIKGKQCKSNLERVYNHLVSFEATSSNCGKPSKSQCTTLYWQQYDGTSHNSVGYVIIIENIPGNGVETIRS